MRFCLELPSSHRAGTAAMRLAVAVNGSVAVFVLSLAAFVVHDIALVEEAGGPYADRRIVLALAFTVASILSLWACFALWAQRKHAFALALPIGILMRLAVDPHPVIVVLLCVQWMFTTYAAWLWKRGRLR